MQAQQALAQIAQQLQALRAGNQSIAAFSQFCRAQNDLLGQLPPAFKQVLEHVLDRLESSALFSEESCSFSQMDLFKHLDEWINKASARLG
jgi:hypothetical protein